jgi:hypothetical protein
MFYVMFGLGDTWNAVLVTPLLLLRGIEYGGIEYFLVKQACIMFLSHFDGT